MVTLVLQCVGDAVTLLFAYLALRVAREGKADQELVRASWLVTGLAFTFTGASSTLQDVAGVWAFVSGPGTEVYDQYLRWSPIGNHSRNFLVVVYGLALLAVSQVRGALPRSFPRLAAGALLAGAVLGGVLGWLEGPVVSGRHWSASAVFSLFWVVALFAALLGALWMNSMDRLHWICVAVYALHGVFDVFFYSALSWIRIAGAWAPRPAQIQFYNVLAYLVMIGITLHRSALARRGKRVPGLLEPVVMGRLMG